MNADFWLPVICLLLPVISGKPHHSVYPHRPVQKRQAVPEYNIDVVALADYKLFEHWVTMSQALTTAKKELDAESKLRQYIALVFEGVNSRYANIPDFKVKVNLVDIDIFKDKTGNHVTPWDTVVGLLNANTTLYQLKNYVATNQIQTHDHVMLFTGHDIFSTDNGTLFKYTTGLAFVGTQCEKDGRSVSVVEDHGGFQSVHTAAHELAHSFNASHDGIQNVCSLRDRYIMAGAPSSMTDANKANPWYFSTCSKTEMTTFFTQTMNTAAECLQQKLPVSGNVPDVSLQKAGQLYGPDAQCQHIYGNESYYCRGRGFGSVTDICHIMSCWSQTHVDQVTCNEHQAADFTSCGNQMWCVNGQCLNSQDAPTKDADCVHGDEPSRQINRKYCGDLIREGSFFCYNETTQLYCCKTCKDNHTGVEDCEYGDRLRGCQTSYCNTIYPNGTILDVTCCGTCSYRPKEWQCRDSSTIPGLDCSKITGSNCYNYTIAFHCCARCSDLRDITKKDCEYGDTVEGCLLLTNQRRTCETDVELRPKCCRTCQPETTSGHVTVTSSLLSLVLCVSIVLLQFDSLRIFQ